MAAVHRAKAARCSVHSEINGTMDTEIDNHFPSESSIKCNEQQQKLEKRRSSTPLLNGIGPTPSPTPERELGSSISCPDLPPVTKRRRSLREPKQRENSCRSDISQEAHGIQCPGKKENSIGKCEATGKGDAGRLAGNGQSGGGNYVIRETQPLCMQSELPGKGDALNSTAEMLASSVCAAEETTAKAFNFSVKLMPKKGRPKKSMSPKKLEKVINDTKSLPLSVKRHHSDVIGTSAEPSCFVTEESDKPIIQPEDTKNLKAKQRAKMSLSPTRLLPTSIVDYFQPLSNISSKKATTPEVKDKTMKDPIPGNDTSPLGSSDNAKLRSRGRPRKSVTLDSIKKKKVPTATLR